MTPEIPEGMPDLPFGMGWSFFMQTHGVIYAQLELQQGASLSIQVTTDSVHMHKFGHAKWTGMVCFSMQNHRDSCNSVTEEFGTPQEAAQAAVVFLTPFIQLSNMKA